METITEQMPGNAFEYAVEMAMKNLFVPEGVTTQDSNYCRETSIKNIEERISGTAFEHAVEMAMKNLFIPYGVTKQKSQSLKK